jgi:protein associated with RNAse G/E
VNEILTVDPRIISIETPNESLKYDLELKNVSNSKIKIADIKEYNNRLHRYNVWLLY